MTSALQVLGGGGVGIFPTTIDATFYNRSGNTLDIGDVMQVDMMPTPATESASVAPGGMGTSIWSNVDDPNAAGIKYGVLCVALESIADNAAGRFRICGIVDAFVIAAAGSVVIGDGLVATTGNNCDLVLAADERIIAIALEAQTTPTTRTLSSVWFNGLPGGFGMDTGT
jgi:hypothetical protein